MTVPKCGSNQVELGSGGAADANEYNWSLSGLVNGWNLISLNIADANQIGTPNLSAINWFRLYNSKSASITTRLDAIQVGPNLPQFVKGINKGNDFLSEPTGKSVNIYPNPFKQGKLSVEIAGFEDMDNVVIKITNLLGQTIYQEMLPNKTHLELNLPGKLNESVYFISVESGDTKVVKKLVVN
ncbi:MAG: T9SS type A sorting domain-containing protein [Paludibacter sp.]|nr:T9SS type A sorting domain-containing protein [Paludibacter sp.]